MNTRLRHMTIWAAVGFAIAAAWATAALLVRFSPVGPIWTIVNITCPALFASWHLHVAARWYWVLAANGAIYALFGLCIEMMRLRFSHKN